MGLLFLRWRSLPTLRGRFFLTARANSVFWIFGASFSVVGFLRAGVFWCSMVKTVLREAPPTPPLAYLSYEGFWIVVPVFSRTILSSVISLQLFLESLRGSLRYRGKVRLFRAVAAHVGIGTSLMSFTFFAHDKNKQPALPR